MSDLLDKLLPIFKDVFDDNDLIINRESSSGKIEGWDSLAHINLVSSIEQEFNIKFALGELEGMKNVGDMIDLMEKKLSQ